MPKNRHLDSLEHALAEITALLAQDESSLAAARPEISGWSVAEQIDHVIKVITSVLKRIADDPAPLDKGINMLGRVILLAGWIPRGKGRSPKNVFAERAARADLLAALNRIREQIDALTSAQIARREPTVPHPFFGGLTSEQALRFIVIHTVHHLKIIREIRAGT